MNDAIVDAEALNTATLQGSESGQVPAAAKPAFTAAITTAKSTRSLVAAIDRQITDAVNKLETERQAFVAAIIP